MAGILGLIDLQQIRQDLGLSRVNIPSKDEIEKIRREKFGSSPLPASPMPDAATLKQAQTLALKGKGVTSLFYRKDGYLVGDLTLDLILDEDHAFASKISSHPVEIGADITDHIQRQLQAGKLRGLVTNHSINARGLTRANARQPGSLGAGRAGAAWEVCRWIWERQEPVTIVTTLDTYPDVGVSNMATRRDPDTGDALVIEFTFQQIRRVAFKTKRADVIVRPGSMTLDVNKQIAPTMSQGRVVGKEVVMDLGEVHLSGVVR